MAVTVTDRAARESREQTYLVDCDVHPLIKDTSVLAPRLSKRVARRVFHGNVGKFARDPNRIPHPSNGLRLDAFPPGGGLPGSDAAFAREQWMDPYDISAAVLIPVQTGVVIPWGDERAANEFISAFNDHLIEEWYGLDPRYRVTVSVSPHDAVAAVKEVERLADTPGVVGVFLPPASVALGRRHYFPLYELAESLGLPIVVHPTGAEANLVSATWVAGGLPRTYPERHSLLFQPGQGMLTSMIFGGVFDAFPKLKFVMSEYAFSWAPGLAARMDLAWERGDRELAGIEKAPSDYIRENVRFTTQPIDEPIDRRDLWALLEMVDADRTLLFSSDYPHWDTDDPTVTLKSQLPSHLRERVAWQNAVETFGAHRLGL
jgi:predicted TIM-barrel fold metal-dependent hydrolase